MTGSGDHAIEVCGVGKRLRLKQSASTVKAAAIDLLRGRRGGAFWALREVSFHVRRGETLGIIGANGAGKTTLLSLIAQTMLPTTGSIQTRGSISSLLELGAGFHPDLTGRENVYLAGAIMGLRRDQIRRRFDAIVDFAGIRKFIDQPVKHFSSGMYVRLGFAVAVEVNPDILLVDEVLAVGDIDFQGKCLERMRAFHDQGKTMLIVSHDLPTIQSISDRILLLDEGRVTHMGKPADIVGSYRLRSGRRAAQGLAREWGSGEVTLTRVVFCDERGQPSESFRWGASLCATIDYEASCRIERPIFGFSISDRQGRLVHGSNTQMEGFSLPHIEGKGALRLCLSGLNLARGTYLFSFSVHSADHRTNYHRLDHAFPVAIECDHDCEGTAYFPCRWERLS